SLCHINLFGAEHQSGTARSLSERVLRLFWHALGSAIDRRRGRIADIDGGPSHASVRTLGSRSHCLFAAAFRNAPVSEAGTTLASFSTPAFSITACAPSSAAIALRCPKASRREGVAGGSF